MIDQLPVLDILLSRLFHDLISPVSATVNGVELLVEFGTGDGGEFQQDALRLVETSAAQSSARLSFFRVAFGGAGSTADQSLADGVELARRYLSGRKIDVALSTSRDAKSVRFAPGSIKVMLGMIAVLAECLPRGGTISISLEGSHGGRAEIAAEGPGARVEPNVADALAGVGVPQVLEAKSILAYFVGLNAARFGASFAVEAKPDRVNVSLNLAE